MTEPKDPRFNYIKYRTKSLSLERLDQIADYVFGEVPATALQKIAAVFKLIAAIGYVWAHKQLVDEAFQIEKQHYEQDQSNGNQNEVDQEDPGRTAPA